MLKTRNTALCGIALLVGLFLNVTEARAEDSIWGKDLAAARTNAQKSSRPILVKFTATWCGTCTEMADGPLKDRGVLAALKDFETVELDVDENKALVDELRIAGLPTLLCIEPGGVLVARNEQFIASEPLVLKLAEFRAMSVKVRAEAESLRVGSGADASDLIRWLNFLVRQGNHKDAIDLASSVLSSPAAASGTRQRCGVIAANSALLIRAFSQARELAAKVCAIDPKDGLASQAMFLGAYAWEVEGRAAEACKEYKALAEAFPATRAGKLASEKAKQLEPDPSPAPEAPEDD